MKRNWIVVVLLQVFYISYTMTVQWLDSRLQYNNLKQQEDLNVLTPGQHGVIWSPQLIFQNTKSKIKSSLAGSTIRVLLNNNFTFERADLSSSNNIYIFKGSENRLEISQVYDTEFKCQGRLPLIRLKAKGVWTLKRLLFFSFSSLIWNLMKPSQSIIWCFILLTRKVSVTNMYKILFIIFTWH